VGEREDLITTTGGNHRGSAYEIFFAQRLTLGKEQVGDYGKKEEGKP